MCPRRKRDGAGRSLEVPAGANPARHSPRRSPPLLAIMIRRRGTHPGALGSFRSGVAHLAGALDAAVVPFGLAGTEAMIPAFADGFHGRHIVGISGRPLTRNTTRQQMLVPRSAMRSRLWAGQSSRVARSTRVRDRRPRTWLARARPRRSASAGSSPLTNSAGKHAQPGRKESSTCTASRKSSARRVFSNVTAVRANCPSSRRLY